MIKVRLLFAWLLCTFSMAVYAQELQAYNRPFVQNGKKWSVQVGLIEENTYYNQVYGDTIIGGDVWKKVCNYVFMPDFGTSYYAAIRDVGKKVYAIAKGSSRPRLLYDFGLKVGDMVRCGVEGNSFACLLDKDEQPDSILGFPFVAYLKVESIDTIKARGLLHRRFKLTLLDTYKQYFRNGEQKVKNNIIWIEGVGSGAGPFLPWVPLPREETFLQGCDIDNACIFGYPDFYRDYESVSIKASRIATNRNSTFYDLQGRRINGKTIKGVYVESGRKKIK